LIPKKLIAFLFVIFPVLSSAITTKPTKPNIVVFIADDWGW